MENRTACCGVNWTLVKEEINGKGQRLCSATIPCKTAAILISLPGCVCDSLDTHDPKSRATPTAGSKLLQLSLLMACAADWGGKEREGSVLRTEALCRGGGANKRRTPLPR